MITLDKRLLAVVNEIKPCKILADIGSDHGKVAIYARLNGLCEHAIASDISPDSIKKADTLIKKLNISGVETRVGDGFDVLKADECDTIVIAGMGGNEIASILLNFKYLANKFIFVPHKNPEVLRVCLSKLNILPTKDYKMLCNGWFYDIIVAENGCYNPTFKQSWYGNNNNNTTFANFCKRELKILNTIISKAKNENLENAICRKNVIEEILNETL